MEAIEGGGGRSGARAAWAGPAAFLALPALLAVNAWWFPHLVGTGYFAWYVQQGLALGLAGSFVALLVDDLEAETGLVSAHPAEYLGTCLQLVGAVFLALSSSVSVRAPEPRRGAAGTLGLLWDLLAGAALSIAVAALTLAWLVVVAPLNYLSTLVAGAPARLSLRGSRSELYVRVRGRRVIVEEAPGAPPEDGSAIHLSLRTRPLAATQAIVALLLGLASLAV